jgi:hypothetical protein
MTVAGRRFVTAGVPDVKAESTTVREAPHDIGGRIHSTTASGLAHPPEGMSVRSSAAVIRTG